MALYLALETATDVPSLALGAPDDPGADLRIPSRRDLSREIESAAGRLLGAHGVSPGGLAGVVVADGPGSFTGLRIGIAFAKGLCRAAGLPLLAAPSLLGAARAAAKGGDVVVAEYDALRGDVYRAAYRLSAGGGGVEVLLAPELASAGSAVAVAGAFTRASAADASAAALLRLVGVPGGAREVEDPAAWEPAYGRPAEAEARLRARGGLPVGGGDRGSGAR